MMQYRQFTASPWRVTWAYQAIKAVLYVILAVFICHNDTLLGEFDSPASIHHLFNAHLLEPKEFQVSLFANAQAGVTESLEVGVQGLGYVTLPTLWNFSLKHRMFTEANFRSSFNSHSFFFPNGADRLLLSLHGVITSYFVQPNHHLNFGLMDGLVMAFSPDSQSSLHLITPVLGWDGVINSRLAFSVTLLRPVYATEEQESQRFGEGNRNLNFTEGKARPAFAMATAIWSFGSLHAELGAVYISYDNALILPYANLFWRFKR